MANDTFNEEKATQVAARFLRARGNGRMKFLKLIKLMYLLDREALRLWGHAVTTDRYVSMDKGPVLSNVYRLINEESETVFWREHIAKAADFDVQLISDPGDYELSAAEENLIDFVFQEHGHKNRWTLVEELHRVPEWTDPNGSMVPIPLREMLLAVGRDPIEIAELEGLATQQAQAVSLFGA